MVKHLETAKIYLPATTKLDSLSLKQLNNYYNYLKPNE